MVASDAKRPTTGCSDCGRPTSKRCVVCRIILCQGHLWVVQDLYVCIDCRDTASAVMWSEAPLEPTDWKLGATNDSPSGPQRIERLAR